MRKITVGAIQPASIPVPEKYNWASEGYAPDPDEILKYCLLPQAEVTFKLLDEAGDSGADIVTTCEDLALASAFAIDTSRNNVFPEIVKLSFPIIEERVSAIAKKRGTNIIACYYKPYNGKIYNLASAFNRNGEIVGEYRKTHLPPEETFQTTEGEDIDTIDLDCARVGVLICYDMFYPEAARVLSLKGAEIVFHPTFGYGWHDSAGEATLRARASDGSFYLVTAKDYRYNAAGKSSVIDFWGNVMVDAGYMPNVFITKTLDLALKKTQPEWFFPAGVTGQPNLRIRHNSGRRPELYAALCDEAASGKRFTGLSPEEQEAFREKARRGVYRW